MAIGKIRFVLCLVACLLIVNVSANAAFPGPGEIPEPPGLADNPNIPDFGEHPSPPGPGDNPNPQGPGGNPPDDQILGLENALGRITEDNPGNGWSIIDQLLDEPDPPGIGPNSVEVQSVDYGFVSYAVNPEPATLGLLVLGGVVALRRRRR